MSGKGLPAIGFFIQRMAKIDAFEASRNYTAMFRLLLITSDNLHKVDREKCEETRRKLEEYLKRIRSTNGRNYNHTLQLRSRIGGTIYDNGGRTAKLTIYDILWEGGYINKTSFRPATRKDTMFNE